MNKILLSALFIVGLFCLPSFALGAAMELTVTVTSIQVPERAAMQLLPVSTEMILYNPALIGVSKASPGIISVSGTGVDGFGTTFTKTFNVGDIISANNQYRVIATIVSDIRMTTTVAWSSTASEVNYYAPRLSYGSTSGRDTTSSLNSGSVVKFAFPYDSTKAPYLVFLEWGGVAQGSNVICKADCTPVPGNSGWYRSSAALYRGSPIVDNFCPAPCSISSYRGNIAFDPLNIVFSSSGSFWRSPTLFTID